MKTRTCPRCGRRKPLRRLHPPGWLDPLGYHRYGPRCRNEDACGDAVDRSSRRSLRRELGRESNADGVLASVLKHATPHRRSTRRGLRA